MKRKLFSYLLLPLVGFCMLFIQSCEDEKSHKKMVCAIVFLTANEDCTQKQIKAQNDYDAALEAYMDYAYANGCYSKIEGVSKNCWDENHRSLKAAKDRLDAANKEAEECRAKNKQLYEDCLQEK